MKYTFTLVIFLLSGVVFSQNDPECLRNIKEGTFTYSLSDNGDEVVIVRKGKKHTETMANGSKLVLKTDWINDSTYVLTFVKSVNYKGPICLEKGDIIKTVIVQCSGNTFKARSSSVNCGSAEVTYTIKE